MTDSYRFAWPDPQAPRVVTRDLTVLRGDKNPKLRRKRGEPKPKPLSLRGVNLIELVPHCLYEVPRYCHELAKGVDELLPGRILSRNLKLSERLNGEPVEEEIKQVFQSFDGVFKARRGLGHPDRQYRSREIPANKQLAGTLDEMMRMSWELRKLDEDGREAYELVAVRAAKKYGRPIDETKREAQARTLQAGNPVDSCGRFNPSRLPLICIAGRGKTAKRIQAVRGIGRRMSWREVVLEHYIDRLREISRDVARSQQHRLRQQWLAPGAKRTPRLVRQEAERLTGAASRLRTIVTRPFARSFTHCANDLDEAARLLCEAADGRNGDTITQAKQIIGRVYRAMIQMECHWRLEEILLQAAILKDRQDELGARQQRTWYEELRAVHGRLTSVDRLTGLRLEDGFRREVLPHVYPHVHLASVHLMRSASDGGADLQTMREELKIAVEPL